MRTRLAGGVYRDMAQPRDDLGTAARGVQPAIIHNKEGGNLK